MRIRLYFLTVGSVTDFISIRSGSTPAGSATMHLFISIIYKLYFYIERSWNSLVVNLHAKNIPYLNRKKTRINCITIKFTNRFMSKMIYDFFTSYLLTRKYVVFFGLALNKIKELWKKVRDNF